MEEKQEKIKKYNREYMAKRYKEDPLSARQYRNSLNIRAKMNISEEEAKQFGIYLADIVKIRKLMEQIPVEHLENIVKQYLENKTNKEK